VSIKHERLTRCVLKVRRKEQTVPLPRSA